MRELEQHEFKKMSSIKNALSQYSNDFRSKINDQQLTRMAERLTIWKVTVRDIETAMEVFIDRGEEKLPTAQQVRQIVSGNKKAAEQSTPLSDPQTEKDILEFKNNYTEAVKVYGKETIEEYIKAWFKVFFNGCEVFLKAANVKTSDFRRLAIKDLKRYGGNFKMALEYAKKEREQNEKQWRKA